MSAPRFFQGISGNLRELPEQGPFRSERELQEFFEKHLHTLTRVEFLESEYSTGQRHRRRIDTLGIDDAGRPVVVEYKRRQDENVINQGLDYLAWLDDHQADFREIVRRRLGEGRVAGIDFTAPRLLCIAARFPRQDKIAAENSRRRIDLLVYRRFGDAFVALEWAHGGEPPAPDGVLRGDSRVRHPSTALGVAGGDDLDYSRYKNWDKISEETRTLFREIEEIAKSIGPVRTDPSRNVISIKCIAAPGNKPPVIAYVHLRSRAGIRLNIHGKHLSHIPIENGFTRPIDRGYREVTIRDREHIRKAEPLLRAAYDNLSKQRSLSPRVTEEEFLESCDEFGKEVFASILALARRDSMPLHWGSKGFSVGVAVDGTRVVVCKAYPPTSMLYKQSLYTTLRDRKRKAGVPEEVIDRLWQAAEVTGLFIPAGRELKCVIDRKFATDEVDALVAWCESVEQAIVGQGQASDPHTGR